LKYRLKIKELINNWESWSKKIAQASKSILGECKVYVFGSAIKNECVGGSDIDILIIKNTIPNKKSLRAEIIVKIEDKAGLPLYHPFEIHLVNEEEAKWYFKHIDKFIQIM